LTERKKNKLILQTRGVDAHINGAV
jgi:hypothetical protein